MRPGDVVAGRFEIGPLVGEGGMGAVFRARDMATLEPVAVKVISGDRVSDRTRFEREASALADVRDPAIVRYVTRGDTPAGEPYLVMEWLEGEDLSRRLLRGRLTTDEAVTLGVRVARGLAAVHQRGIVHRDIKPSNLFLVNGAIDRVKILDFGIARLFNAPQITKTGMLLGTPAYMSPEQARSGEAVDARADVFSLGCVLFECLTGTPAFTGEHPFAILAKIVFDEVPRVRELRRDVPEWLAANVAQMLEKEPRMRHRGCDAVADALALPAPDTMPGAWTPPPSSALAPALTRGEQRVLSVTMVARAAPFGTTLHAGEPLPAQDELRTVAERSGARLEELSDGSAVVTILGTGAVTDQTVRAARCALALRARAGGRAMALATGRGEVMGRVPVGEVIDRAARLLARAQVEAARGAEDRPQPIAIDDVTAALLDFRFELAKEEGACELLGERDIVHDARALLGKPTACVGREREIATLRSVFTECVEDSVARAVLVTAPPGGGKSRVAQEFVRGLRQSGDPAEVWIGRGDPLRAGSAFGLLAQALRGAFRLRDDEPLAVRQEKLRARVAQRVPPSDQRRVAEFLGELLGTPLPDRDSAPLRAARQDAQLMAEQMRRAWEDFLRAECEACPVLLVFEDLHWGDLPSVRFIDLALRSLSDRPWSVLALSRPDVHTLFPRLWADRNVLELRLSPLTRKASERLVRQVLGPEVPPATVERLILLADGNAFYLEELIRAASAGKGDALPDTVLAMVEARLGALEPEARRVLRAASVFGEVLWPGGVTALLGGRKRAAMVNDWLARLVERELLVPRADSRFAGEPELAFRHALLREGAYAMLTREDRILGHRLAAAWLEERGENDAMTLAEHFERGDEPGRASIHYLRAAEQAFRGGDAETALARAKRGLAGAPDDVRVGLLSVLGESHSWRAEWDAAAAYAEDLLRLATRGSAAWSMAMALRLAHARHRGAMDELIERLNVLLSVEPSADAVATFAWAATMGIYLLDMVGRHEHAAASLERLHTILEPFFGRDPVARASIGLVQAHRGAWIHEDPWSGLRWARLARAKFEEVGNRRYALVSQVFLAANRILLGAFPEAERELRGMQGHEDELGFISSLQKRLLVEVLLARGAVDDARQEALRMIEAACERSLVVDEGRGRWSLADVLRHAGDFDGAEREALAAVDLLGGAPLDAAAARGSLAAIRLAQRRIEEALATAEEAMASFEALRAPGFRGAFVRLVHAEALRAAGQDERARAAVAAARDRLLANADKIGDPDLRRSFLERVPENARTLALARLW